MKHQYIVSGMTCDGCRKKVAATLAKVDGVTVADVTLDPPQATITMDRHVPESDLNAALASAGSYSLKEIADARHHKPAPAVQELPEKSVTTYKPLLVVVGYILLATAISQINLGRFDWMEAMRVFMGSFFLAFSFFKLLDLKGFAYAYMSYDIIARRWLPWGYAYPMIELLLGVAYLTGFDPFITNAVTLVVMGVSSVGVIQSVLDKRQIKCACLGTGFNLPMSTVTIIEDVSMVVMAAAMLVFG